MISPTMKSSGAMQMHGATTVNEPDLVRASLEKRDLTGMTDMKHMIAVSCAVYDSTNSECHEKRQASLAPAPPHQHWRYLWPWALAPLLFIVGRMLVSSVSMERPVRPVCLLLSLHLRHET